ncbi:MAG: elongation factor G [Bacilli bacterium]|nr:elongation factor G [Bacilli bacterium]
MKEYKTSEVRNIAILGHMGSGKTSFGEAALFVSKAIEKKGEVERKNTVGDYSVEEQNRQTTLNTALLPVEWKDHKINILDTPGSEEFIGELGNVLAVVDGAVLLIDATKGVEVGAERVWDELAKRNIPTIILINKMDKENIKYENVLESIKTKLSPKAVEFSFPIGTQDDFRGYAGVTDKLAHIYDGVKCNEEPLPNDVTDKVEELYGQLLESVAETSEELLDKYFGGEELTEEEVAGGLCQAIKDGDLYPIMVASSTKNIGLESMLNMVVKYLPSPSGKSLTGVHPKTKETITKEIKEDAPLSGYIFKTTIDPFIGSINFFKVISGSIKVAQDVYLPETDTTIKVPQLFTLRGKTQIPLETIYAGDIACVGKVGEFHTGLTFCDKKDPVMFDKVEHPTPIIYVAIQAKTKQDEDKISGSLSKLRQEDETLEIKRNPETAQLLVGGQGLTHIGYVLEKMKNMFKVDVDILDQKIVYRETIRSKGEAQGRHKKQSGGAGQFGDVWIRFEPTSENFEFAEEVVGGAVPKNYFPAVEKGLIETLEHGPLAGFPVIGVKATLFDGSYHPVDSNEISFKLAASLAFKNALDKLRPTILEPIYEVKITIKDEFVGDIMGDITKRRGRVLGMDQKDGVQFIIAEVPEAEIIKYAVDLKAMTQASGRFSREFLRYDQVPEHLVSKIIEEYKK